jgi:hypothetical protein
LSIKLPQALAFVINERENCVRFPERLLSNMNRSLPDGQRVGQDGRDIPKV